MNRMTKLIGYGTAALLAIASCSRMEDIGMDGTPEMIHMTVYAGTPDTRTVISDQGNEEYDVLWSAGDVLGAVQTDTWEYAGNANYKYSYLLESAPLASGGKTAGFEFTFTNDIKAGTKVGLDFTFVYPSSALTEVSTNQFRVTLPSAQTFPAGSFDPAADVLVSSQWHMNSPAYPVEGFRASFARLGGTARMTIKAPTTTETIQKIIFSSTANIKIAGSYALDRITGEISADMLSGTNSITLTPSVSTTYTGDIDVWFRLAEVTLTDNFTVSVVTSEKTYTKTLYLSSLGRSLEFRNSALTTFGVDMRSVGGVANSRTDVINSEFTGVPSTTYEAWSDKRGSSSDAVYAGKTAKRSSGEIGMRQQDNDCGIVTTSSGGTVKSVTLTIHNETSYTRTVNIYAKNTAYTTAGDLFGDNKGTLIQSVEFPANTASALETVVVPGNYKYVGINCPSYSVDLAEIRVTWEGAPSPDVVTGEASAIHAAGATLAGSYASAPGGIYEAGFYWDTSSSDLENLVHPTQVVTTDGSAATGGNFSCDLGSLNELTTYYYRAYVLWLNAETNTYEEYLGEVCSFSTVARDYSVAGWLELPSYTVSAMAGTTTSSLTDLYHVTHKAEMGGIQQRNYTLLYDPEMLASYWVAYPLCSDHLSSGRVDSWGIWDPRVPSEKQVNLNKGYGVNVVSTAFPSEQYYARGHQMPNADRNGVAAMQEQTYYPTNITPQLQNGFNAGIWLDLEAAVRSAVHDGDTVYVVTGAAFRKKDGAEVINTITNTYSQEIPVPNYYWKVLLKVKRSGESVNNAKAIGFWMEHRDDLRENTSAYQNYAISVDQIEAWTGFDFFANLPEALQIACEDDTDWPAFRDF